MTDTLLSIIGTLIAAVVGVVPGFLLSEWGTSRRDARSERRKAGTVRLIIGIEIDQNLNELKQFQARMDKDQREAPQPHELVLLLSN